MEKTLNKMIDNIKASKRELKIGFPDGDDPRIVTTVKELAKIPNVKPIIINQTLINGYNQETLINTFTAARQGKKETMSDFQQWSKIPNYVAMALLKNNEIDCIVGGATTPTADLLRPALQIIGSKDQLITSYFWMNKQDHNYFLGDCAIIPDPNQDQLFKIAKQISQSSMQLFDIKPFIAMLSFSTNGSGGDSHQSIKDVRGATELLKKEQYNVLGETQFDAAFDAKTRNYKWKQTIDNQPNIYIFPNLNAGNIGYKIMKLTGDYEAIGPIITGLNKPVNDLSRGADAQEVYNLAIITLNMVLNQEK